MTTLSSTLPTSHPLVLGDPFWKSKLILTYPNDDDAVAYLFALIISKYGHSWLQQLVENDVQWVKGTATPANDIIRLHNSTNSTRVLSLTTVSAGNNTWWSLRTPNDQSMTWARTGVIFADTPKPEAAKLFISWLTSDEYQTPQASISTRYSLNSGDSIPLLRNVTQTSGFRQFEGDRATVEWWKNLFEDALGTAQGPSPLRVYPNSPYQG